MPARAEHTTWRTAALLIVLLVARAASAAEHSGQVTFQGTPVPGATVTASRGEERLSAFTDERGTYRFPDLAEGTWTIAVDMLGFRPVQLAITAGTDTPLTTIPLTARPFSELAASTTVVRANPADRSGGTVLLAPQPDSSPGEPARDSLVPADATPEPAADAADGFLINGSVNNAASSPFAQGAAFGNNRSLRRSLYNGTFGAVAGNSAWDSRPFSFTSAPAPKPSYNDLQILGTFGGPVPTRGSLATRPNFFAGYQRSFEHAASAQSGIVPTSLERSGNFGGSVDASGGPVAVRDPLNGEAFPDGQVPAARLSAEALALLALYPLPNTDGGGRYNYQAPVLTRTEREGLQLRVAQNPNPRNQLLANVQYQRAGTEATSLFGFTSRNSASTLDASTTWSRRISPFLTSRLRYQFTRAVTDISPHFARRQDVIGDSGIAGADRAPENWGPPALTFSSGLLGLGDVQYSDTSTRTHGLVGEALVTRTRHNVTFGGGVRRVNVDAFGQQNGRGLFTFTGAATGSDLADFLLGLPRTAALAFGNNDKRLHGNLIEAYVTDDWRVTPGLTVNAGVRWDYEGPLSERFGRLSNLDLAPDFGVAAIVTPARPDGGVTGRPFPSSLLHADRSGIQPRIGVAWRPVAGSSLVVRGGYGVYRNTSTYQSIALLMAQQPPFSNALSLESSPSSLLTLRDGLLAPASSPATFAVDPAFRIGNAHNWQLLAQRDLPASLTMSAGYLGSRGTRLMQEFLPNTVPEGADNPCPTCPVGFAYLTSGGTSIRHAGQVQIRRRLRNGLQASGQYTYSWAEDNAAAFTGAALTGAAIAQNWRDLDAERGPSSFNQRHLFTADVQYTTGVGAAGGGLLTGVRGALFRGWTLTSQMTAGSGFPVTPVYLGALPGTGVTGSLRASLSGAPEPAPPGYYLNPESFAIPEPGTWGNAGRNSVTGPRQFALSAGITRSFPWGERTTLDWRIDASNVLNVVTYAAINPVVGSPQFGLPTRANPMRKVQTTFRLRF